MDEYNIQMSRKKAVLFDVDGVLLDTWAFVFQALQYTLSFHGYPKSMDEIRKVMGQPLLDFYKSLVPEGPSEVLAQTHKSFQKERFHLSKAFPKTKKVLKTLKSKGILLAAISNRTKSSLDRSLKNAQIYKYFDLVLYVEDVKNPKPHPDHIHLALKKLKVRPNQAYLVGDTKVDILAGKNAGVKTVAVTYGFAGKDILKHNPDFVIDDLEDLIKIIQNPSSFPKNMGLKSSLK